MGFSKRSLCEFNGKIVPKKSLIGTKGQVFRGTKLKTKGGLVKKDLMKNKQGKVISKKRYATGRKNFKNGGIAKWSKADGSTKESWHHRILRREEGFCFVQRSPQNLRRLNQCVV